MYGVNFIKRAGTFCVPVIDWVKITSLEGTMKTTLDFASDQNPQHLPVLEVKRLGPLPIIRHFLDKLDVKGIIDSACPKPDSDVSNGECIEALVMAIFLDKEHALSRVSGLLEAYDLQSLFRPDFHASQLHDTRLGNCMDDLYDHAPTIYGDIVARTIRVFGLKIGHMSLDAAKILLYGDYPCFDDYMKHADTIAFPERGWNPEGRKDLKQLLLELVVSDDSLPILYGVSDGNASESNEYLKMLKRLNTIQADLSKAVLAVDSKGCSPETLIEAAEQNLRLVTLVPETYNLRRDLVKSASNEELPVLLTTESGSEYRGRSYRIPLLIDFPKEEERESKRVWWRYLVVYSTEKAELEKRRRTWEKEDEQKQLEKKIHSFGSKKVFACEADAKQEAEAWCRLQKLQYFKLTWTIRDGVIRRGPGKPSGKGIKANDQKGWGLFFAIEEIIRPATKYDPDAMFVLLSTTSDQRILSDADILEGYRGRNAVEMSFHWLKGDAAVAPMFLKLASRIQTMGFVFVLWMLIYGLIQREIRKALTERGGKCPHPDNRWVDRPTTRGVLDLFDHVSITRCQLPGGNSFGQIQFWKPEFDRVLELLGSDSLYKQYSGGAIN